MAAGMLAAAAAGAALGVVRTVAEAVIDVPGRRRRASLPTT